MLRCCCAVLLLSRMLGAVEVKAPGAAVAVSKAGVIVETDRPGGFCDGCYNNDSCV